MKKEGVGKTVCPVKTSLNRPLHYFRTDDECIFLWRVNGNEMTAFTDARRFRLLPGEQSEGRRGLKYLASKINKLKLIALFLLPYSNGSGIPCSRLSNIVKALIITKN